MRILCGTILAVAVAAAATGLSDVSKVDSRYFADESGKTFVPVGCNICFPRMYVAGLPDSRAECETKLFGWLRAFAANGGNYTRLWLGHSFFEIMPERVGEYDPAAEATLKRTFHGDASAGPSGTAKDFCIDYIAVDSAHADSFKVIDRDTILDRISSDHAPVKVTLTPISQHSSRSAPTFVQVANER